MGDFSKKVSKEKLAKLKVQQIFLTKSCNASLNAIKLCNPDYFLEVTAMTEELQKEREEEKKILSGQISDIFSHLNDFQTNIKRDTKLKDFNADTCREKLLIIQEKINSLKENIEQQSYLLAEEEKTLQTEVGVAQRRLEEGDLSERPRGGVVCSKVRRARAQSQTKDQDIEEFERLVERRGHTGGWEEADHLLFLRLRRQHRGTSLPPALQTHLPDVTLEQIKEHEEWFQNYQSLKEKHKQAIEKWKASKKKEKKGVENDSTKRKNSTSSDCTQNDKKKTEIAEWRKQRQLRQETLARELRAHHEAEEAKQRAEREKQVQLREAVLQYRHQKVKEHRETQQAREARERAERQEKAAQARRLIKTFRKLDELFIERQKILRQRTPAPCELPRVSGASEAERDPTRLLQHTQVWQAHCQAKPDPFKPILHLRNMPHLAVPAWRKGVL